MVLLIRSVDITDQSRTIGSLSRQCVLLYDESVPVPSLLLTGLLLLCNFADGSSCVTSAPFTILRGRLLTQPPRSDHSSVRELAARDARPLCIATPPLPMPCSRSLLLLLFLFPPAHGSLNDLVLPILVSCRRASSTPPLLFKSSDARESWLPCHTWHLNQRSYRFT